MLMMTILALVVLGLCLGSFVNALVWRVHEQARETDKKKADKARLQSLSIAKGRSICPKCGHGLAAKDLVPLFSWLALRGKCRYCHAKIPIQYPLVELATAGLFVVSYIWWPHDLTGAQNVVFGLWLILLTGLMALLVYDLRWYQLPNRILYPLSFVAGLLAVIQAASADDPLRAVVDTALSVVVAGGLFYVLFQVSDGKWIGGGDVKLGWLLGLVLGSPAKSLLMIFGAALLGSLVSVPLMANKKLKRTSVIPFGPFLIISTIFVVLFGQAILDWYQHTILML
jgi:prepilin signal peptidase PulO-like enzyme (type II secretory pathway)